MPIDPFAALNAMLRAEATRTAEPAGAGRPDRDTVTATEPRSPAAEEPAGPRADTSAT
ncbi:hypothetical protein [Streptomyces sp. CAU 1734]|uniref:hypothetical protein n=1 Tax=Streptomyces sp. CAU 1734 TaxID=3140360 RepID=UPI00326083DE